MTPRVQRGGQAAQPHGRHPRRLPHYDDRSWEELILATLTPLALKHSHATRRVLEDIAREAEGLGPALPRRRPRRDDRLPAYAWAKYARYGWALAVLSRLHHALRIPNALLIPLIEALARPHGPFPGFPVRALQRRRAFKGTRVERWKRPRWAALLLGALLSTPVSQIALFLVAAELSCSAASARRLIERAHAEVRPTSVQLTLPRRIP